MKTLILLGALALAALPAWSSAQDAKAQDVIAQDVIAQHKAEVKALQAQIRKEEKKRHIKNGAMVQSGGNWRDLAIFEMDKIATGSTVNAAIVTYAVHTSHEALDRAKAAQEEAAAAAAAANAASQAKPPQ